MNVLPLWCGADLIDIRLQDSHGVYPLTLNRSQLDCTATVVRNLDW